MTHPKEHRLNDYADEALAPERRAEVEAHLEGCRPCRKRIEEIMELGRAARALPRSVPPARDLWPEIEARIRRRDTDRPVERRRGTGGRRPLRWDGLLAAAAVALLIAAGVWYGVYGPWGETPPPSGGAPSVATGTVESGAGEVQLAALEELDREYQAAAADLRAILEAGEGRLAPETMAVLDENLRIIEEAILESRQALQEDPATPAVLSRLRGMYDLKLEVLRQAVRLSDA